MTEESEKNINEKDKQEKIITSSDDLNPNKIDGMNENEDSDTEEYYPSDPREVFKKISSLNKSQITRLLISLCIIIAFGICNNVQIIGNPTPHNLNGKICYEDAVLDFFRPLNIYFSSEEHKFYRTFLEISASVAIDIVYLVSYFSWAIYAVDWRYGWCTMFYYGPRALVQEIVRLCYPDYMFFPNPGFPSIVVGYIQGSDFFWSGHVGFPLIAAIEFYWLGKYKLTYYCVFVSFLEAFTMMNCREHYTIDIVAGWLFSTWLTLVNYDWFEKIYSIKFLAELRQKNRDELKRIGVSFDVVNKKEI